MVVFDCFILRHEFDEDPYRAEGLMGIRYTRGGWSRSHVRGLGENHPPKGESVRSGKIKSWVSGVKPLKRGHDRTLKIP